MLLEPFAHLVAHQAFERLAHLGADELVLGLAAELRIGQLHRDDRGQPFAHVLAGQRNLLALQHAGLLGIIVDRASERRAESRHVGAAVALRDVVGERQDVLVIAVVPFERDVDADPVAHRRNGDGLGEQGALGAIEPFYESGDPALVIKLVLNPLVMPRISEDQAHTRIQESELAVAMLELLEIEVGDLEGVGARQEGHAGALLALGCRADDLERRLGLAVAKAHEMLLAVAPDGQIEPFGERIDDADADAVETAGHLVGIIVAGVLELTASMKLGHDDFSRRHAFLRMDSGRDSAAIVLDRHGTVGIELNEDPVAMAGKRFVDRIVADLEHHMVKTRAVVGVTDVHAGALAHRVEALEDLDALGVVGVAVGVAFGGRCHSPDIGNLPAMSRARTGARARDESLSRERG